MNVLANPGSVTRRVRRRTEFFSWSSKSMRIGRTEPRQRTIYRPARWSCWKGRHHHRRRRLDCCSSLLAECWVWGVCLTTLSCTHGGYYLLRCAMSRSDCCIMGERRAKTRHSSRSRPVFTSITPLLSLFNTPSVDEHHQGLDHAGTSAAALALTLFQPLHCRWVFLWNFWR